MTVDGLVDAPGYPAAAIGPTEFRRQLRASGTVCETGVDGVFGHSATFERIVDAVQGAVAALGGGRFELLHFPPVIARTIVERAGYVRSFPDLVGSVHVFRGGEEEYADLLQRCAEGQDWTTGFEPAEVTLSSAACHPVYPLCAGQLPPDGRRVEVRGYCFRHEPSRQITRQQAFRMHELVFIGEPDQALAHRETGLADGLDLLSALGLEVRAEVANDPFFGRAGAILADGQRRDSSKYEGVTMVGGLPTAVMSSNYARDHFGDAFGITTADGSVAHSSCVAFGLDRITLALLSTHGLEVDHWPLQVRNRLWQ
jgi:seryl-tRNA synthetase